MYTCHSPIYHYIIVTVVYCVLYNSCACRGYVTIELVSPKDEYELGVLEIEEYLFKERFDTKYLHQVSYLIDACAHHTAVVQYITIYITATAVYLTQRFITACVVVM